MDEMKVFRQLFTLSTNTLELYKRGVRTGGISYDREYYKILINRVHNNFKFFVARLTSDEIKMLFDENELPIQYQKFVDRKIKNEQV